MFPPSLLICSLYNSNSTFKTVSSLYLISPSRFFPRFLLCIIVVPRIHTLGRADGRTGWSPASLLASCWPSAFKQDLLTSGRGRRDDSGRSSDGHGLDRQCVRLHLSQARGRGRVPQLTLHCEFASCRLSSLSRDLRVALAMRPRRVIRDLLQLRAEPRRGHFPNATPPIARDLLVPVWFRYSTSTGSSLLRLSATSPWSLSDRRCMQYPTLDHDGVPAISSLTSLGAVFRQKPRGRTDL
ncbi:hypothetical protein C8F01DRAFT_222869 [Mycena amicta]|nr:hypothetical protein C8F01DRAFT_222869 [Mycena amicta]